MSAPRHAVPKDVTTAFYVWVVSLAVSLVGQVLGMPSIDDAVRKATAASPAHPGVPAGAPMSPEDLHSIAKVGMAVGIVVMLGGVALLLYFGFRMRAGRNWARVVIAVVVGINAAFVLFNLEQTSMWQAVSLVLAAAAVYFSYRPAARDYFTSSRRPSPTE